MAKEFDIYLRKHLVECDLLVYSIPYHDGISVADRLILETALNGYLLCKFAAAQMGAEVEAHIGQMIKLCLEKLSMGAELDTSADFEAHARLYMENSKVVIESSAVNMLERIFHEVENGLILAAGPLTTQVSSSVGRGNFPMWADAHVTGMLKHSLLNLRCVTVPDAEIKQFYQVNCIDADAPAVIDSSLRSLCYKLVFEAAAAVEIVTLVLGTEIRRSLGVWYNGLALDSKVTGTRLQKFTAAEGVSAIMQEAAGTLIKVLYPGDDGTTIEIPALNIGIKRYRRLNEMDNSRLADIDSMTLNELDYVWLT